MGGKRASWFRSGYPFQSFLSQRDRTGFIYGGESRHGDNRINWRSIVAFVNISKLKRKCKNEHFSSNFLFFSINALDGRFEEIVEWRHFSPILSQVRGGNMKLTLLLFFAVALFSAFGASNTLNWFSRLSPRLNRSLFVFLCPAIAYSSCPFPRNSPWEH